VSSHPSDISPKIPFGNPPSIEDLGIICLSLSRKHSKGDFTPEVSRMYIEGLSMLYELTEGEQLHLAKVVDALLEEEKA
jgi:hypothetical protein